MEHRKLLRVIVEDGDTRISGTGGFPKPKPKDIGREVVVKRRCLTWNGVLGYFADDKDKTTYAFYLAELED